MGERLDRTQEVAGSSPASSIPPVGQQGLGVVGELQGYLFVNYEDAYAIDKCFGDMALETSIDLLGDLASP